MSNGIEGGNEGLGETVEPAALHERLARGERLTILDVRDRDEFETWHVDGPNATAVQHPYVRFLQANVTDEVPELAAKLDLDEPVVVVCALGKTSDHAAGLLRSAGVEAANLAGGMDAWADLYVGTELDSPDGAGGPTVIQYVRPATGCLAYLVVSGDEAAVIDPLRAFADRYAADAAERGATLRYAVDSHVHADHVSGARAVAERSDADLALPAGARDRGITYDATFLADGDALTVGDAAVRARHAPGHTTELQVFALDGLAFTADALFLDSVGRPDLEGGDEGARDLAAAQFETLHERLFDLPDDTLIAPGHVGPDTTAGDDGAYVAPLAEVRERVARLGSDREAFVDRLVSNLPPRPANYERIIAVNLGREDLDEGGADDLELGPNNCAVASAD